MEKDYYAGRGCKCGANYAEDCFCQNVDWTPKEVYEARAERDRAMSIVRRLAEWAVTPIQIAGSTLTDAKATVDGICADARVLVEEERK